MTEELQKINEEASKFYNYEQAVKLMLNSIYGAFGNPYFYFFNVDIAETITLQGKDAILYTENLVNKYFKEYWHKDTAAHQAMGITVTCKIEKPVGIYIDTDSVFFSAVPLMDKRTPNWREESQDTIAGYVDVIAGEVQDYLNNFYDILSEKIFNVDRTKHRLEIKKEYVAKAGL